MALETRSAGILRFGTFEVDVRSGELRKQGVRIKLQEQPFHVLTVLLQRPGEVVTREESFAIRTGPLIPSSISTTV